MNVTEAFKFSGLADNSTPFSAFGGKYLLTAIGTFPGFVGIDQLGPDGVTYVPVVGFTSDATNSTTLTGNGSALYDLPPGKYRLSVATATAVAATLARVPY